MQGCIWTCYAYAYAYASQVKQVTKDRFNSSVRVTEIS